MRLPKPFDVKGRLNAATVNAVSRVGLAPCRLRTYKEGGPLQARPHHAVHGYHSAGTLSGWVFSTWWWAPTGRTK